MILLEFGKLKNLKNYNHEKKSRPRFPQRPKTANTK